MNFTREPIIETIITPREGFKLVVRSSKGGGQEEYSVEALEVVSFGHSFFFRSLERPKSFLVPVSDYEVLEVKETRIVLKNASAEKTIKIGGGREASIKAPREPGAEKPQESPAADASKKPGAGEPRQDKKRDRRRNRRRRGGSEEGRELESGEAQTETVETPSIVETEGQPPVQPEEPKAAPTPVFSRLFPPPPSLISETLGKEKKKEEESPSVEPSPSQDTSGQDSSSGGESSGMGSSGGESQKLDRQMDEPSPPSSTSSFFRIFLP